MQNNTNRSPASRNMVSMHRKDDYQKLLAESGGASTVLHGMERHKSADDAQQHGCKAPAVMTCNVDN